MKSIPTLPRPKLAPALIFLTAALLLAACGGGSGGSESQSTGSLSFSVQWDRSSRAIGPADRTGTDDCLDVALVTAAAYDTSGALLQTGGPWDCGDHAGTLSLVPANRQVRVAIVGLDAGGIALYRGQSSEAFYLPGGVSVDAGLIVAGSFGATLTSPADRENVPASTLTLTWSAVPGADGYVVQVADDAAFDAASILQTLSVNASAAPSCRPNTAGMMEDTAYFWRVQVVDGAGNTSPPSSSRGFYLNFDGLGVTVITPNDGGVVQLGASATFDAEVTAPGGATLNMADLAYVEWYSSIDGPLSDQLNFSTSTLAGGDHTIYLNAEDLDGYYGSTSISFRVNRPPVATIVSPYDGFTDYGPNDIDCNGTATDPEDITITVTANLQWQLFSPGGSLLDTANGISPTFSADNFSAGGGEGDYTITFQVTDSNGSSDSDSVVFRWTVGP